MAWNVTAAAYSLMASVADGQDHSAHWKLTRVADQVSLYHESEVTLDDVRASLCV